MPLPVPYIQNQSIAFSRISGYYTEEKKKTTKKQLPSDLVLSKFQQLRLKRVNRTGRRRAERSLPLPQEPLAGPQPTKPQSKLMSLRKMTFMLSLPLGCNLSFCLVILPCLDIYKIPPPPPFPTHPPVMFLIVTPKFSLLCGRAHHNSHKIVQNVQPFTRVHTREDNCKHCFSMQASNNKQLNLRQISYQPRESLKSLINRKEHLPNSYQQCPHCSEMFLGSTAPRRLSWSPVVLTPQPAQQASLQAPQLGFQSPTAAGVEASSSLLRER